MEKHVSLKLKYVYARDRKFSENGCKTRRVSHTYLPGVLYFGLSRLDCVIVFEIDDASQ